MLNAAARVVSGTRKFDRGLTQPLQADLHWLDVHECVIKVSHTEYLALNQKRIEEQRNEN